MYNKVKNVYLHNTNIKKVEIMSKLLSYKQIKLANELVADGYELQPNEKNRNTLVLIKGNTTIKLFPPKK